MAQEFSQQSSHRDEEHDTPPPPAPVSGHSSDTEVDSLLADIDDVLETNAESFVRGFVQKGGQ